MDKFGLPEAVIQNICSIFSDYPNIKQVLLYGSRAMGTWRNGSDIDLSIVGNDLNFSDLLAIEMRIDDLLIPWKVDLSLLHHIENTDLIEHIRRVGKIFYQT